jgi:hypothetical protein
MHTLWIHREWRIPVKIWSAKPWDPQLPLEQRPRSQHPWNPRMDFNVREVGLR